MMADLGVFELFSGLGLSEQRRLNEISEYWDFYLGDQWRVVREEGESLITFNYAKAIVDKSVSFLFGKGFRIQPHKEVAQELKPLLDEVWEYNKKDILGVEIGQMGAITGDCFIKVSWEDPEVDDNGMLYEEEYPDGKVRINVLPTSSVFPVYSSHDKDKMVSCTIQYAILEMGIEGKPVARMYKEVVTRDTISYYIDNELVEEIPNILREINIVQIKNIPLAGESRGQSDLKSIIPLQKELNAKVTDVSDIINYHSAPITIIQGAKSKNLEKGAKKVWGGLPKDAKVYNLELNSDLNASNNFISAIKTAIHELSNTPEDSLGGKSAVSNTTGVALQIKYAPLLEKTWLKRQTYGGGIKDVCRLIIKLLRVKGSDEERKLLNDLMSTSEGIKKVFDITVTFPDPLPKDEMVQLQIIAQKMNLGLEEPEGALKELGYEGDIQEKLEKIRKYQKEQQNLMFDLAGAENIDIAGIQSQFDADIGDNDLEE